MTRTGFFSKGKRDLPKAHQEEMVLFYKMLLKMKKHHPTLNVNRVMLRLYSNFKIEEL